MGVTGLWQILHPYAVPIKLETLNRKRLAVDASIWIYQFLKAVRDKEGNALRNSHVVGFYRRICKLLFFGIKPVFVFDGGAPVLKRQTVSDRKKRREGRREDAVRTAGRLLAVQMQRRAEEEEQKRKAERDRGDEEEEAVPDEALVYADENLMTQQERQQNRKFRKKDAYHLPDLDVSLNEMGQPNDPRITSLEELQAYAKQFEAGEDINVYDFSKIDYDSSFFVSLPASDRYNILNAARLRSRLRMGYSKEQLDGMFQDRMEFSRFQIERVRERNELTQRLMHLNEGGDTLFNTGGRVAGEKGREYVLVKNDGVEGGWALGVISDEGTKQETAIDLDKPAPLLKQEDDESEEDDGFEDVPIEGLNRLPKRPKLDSDGVNGYSKQRQAFYKSRKAGARRRPKQATDPSSLFVQDEAVDEAADENGEWEEVDGNAELFGETEEEEELQRAIAMSLQNDEPPSSLVEQSNPADKDADASDDDMQEVFNQSAVPEAQPLPKGSGRAIANLVNKRAYDTAPETREVTSFGVPSQKPDESDSGEDTVDLQAALAESRKTKRKVTPPAQRRQPSASKPKDAATEVARQAGFSGPLPFEKLDLGSSLLGKKKMQQRNEETAGGFENPEVAQKEQKKTAEPLPPWFSGSVEEDLQKQRELESEDRQRTREFNRQFQFQSRDDGALGRERIEVIDVDADEEKSGVGNGEVIDLEADDDEGDVVKEAGFLYDPKDQLQQETDQGSQALQDHEVDEDPETPSSKTDALLQGQAKDVDEDHEVMIDDDTTNDLAPLATTKAPNQDDEDDDMLDWSDSDNEKADRTATQNKPVPETRESRSPSTDFEDVAIPDKPAEHPKLTQPTTRDAQEEQKPARLAQQDSMADDLEEEEFDDFSDPEDEQLLVQLAKEAEEHARFASTLNNKSQAQNIADYEKELKQLRNQQKKDRRDADEVTHIMITECQQLLRLFGLPYVTAPMEAEAQCAELVHLGLVDGIVTDDSDCFLFGGTRVYKNMFNQAKLVECYLSSDLEKAGWPRDKLVQAAHLLGSDYTEGLPGIGPVSAAEILGEFQTLDEFKDWLSGVQMNTIPKTEDSNKPVRKKLRKQSTKLFLPPTFPDARVDIAYTNPDVDTDPEPFQWGVPDLDALRQFLMATIGWSQERTDEVLVPVIRDMNRRMDEGTQSNITAFFDGGVGIGAAGNANSRNDAFAPRQKAGGASKRMGSALSRMAEKAKMRREGITNDNDAEVNDEPGDQPAPSGGKSKAKAKKGAKRKSPDPDPVPSDDDDNASEFEAPTKKKVRRRGNAAKPSKAKN